MARRTNTEELVHCESCGEDYSATYKSCPFCGEKYSTRPIHSSDDDDDDDGYVFDGQDLFDDPEDTQVVTTKGGKRLSGTATATRRTTTQSRSSGAAAINWPRLISFICSLIIIVAALVIIFTVIFPQIHDDPNADKSTPPASSSQAVESDPVSDPSDEVTDPAASDAPVIDPSLTRLYMKGPTDTDFTLRVGETHTLTPGFEPADWSGEVTFTSSDPNYATVDENGKVTNVNNTSSLRRVTITVSAGGQTVECTVYCRGTGASSSAPPVVVTPTPDPNASQEPATSGLTVGATGTIVNAASGLRVRSGPGTSYTILASLVNGNKVTILADAGNGWYQISYAGSSGTATGYIMGDFISVD